MVSREEARVDQLQVEIIGEVNGLSRNVRLCVWKWNTTGNGGE